MSMAQNGSPSDPKTQSALTFASLLVKSKGHVSQSDLELVKLAGYNEAEIAEILAHVSLNIFTNYTNVAFAVPLDFPKVKLT